MSEIKLPYYWKDYLLELLCTQGFDAVIKQIEDWLQENQLIVFDERKAAK